MARRGFRRSSGTLRLRLQAWEFEVLDNLFRQSERLLGPPAAEDPHDPLAAAVGIAPVAERPSDPALVRLLPDAYPDDPGAADDFRRFTESDLRRQKAGNAALARDSLSRVADQTLILGEAEGQAWLLALTDLRLVLAVRLGIAESDSDQVHGPTEVYDWLTWLQSTLVDALMP